MAAVTICSDFGIQKNKVWHCFPIYFLSLIIREMQIKTKMKYDVTIWRYGIRNKRIQNLKDQYPRKSIYWSESSTLYHFFIWDICWYLTVLLEKTLESPLVCKVIQPLHSKGDASWVFFGRNDAKAETPVLWPPHAKSWLIGKDCDAGRACGQEEKGMTEDEMAGWHQGLDGCEFEWTPGVGDGQGGLACCNLWGRKESNMTEWLNWSKLNLWKTVRLEVNWEIKS